MKRLHIICIFYLLTQSSYGQGIFRAYSGAGTLGLTVLPATAEPNSFLPGTSATLTQYTKPGLALATTWPYALANVIHGQAAVVLPLQKNNFLGIQMAGQGDEFLSEFFLAGAYAKKITDRWAMGVQAGILNKSIQNWASIWNITIEASTLFHLNERLQIGYRLNYFTQSLTREEISSQLENQLGVRFLPTDQLILGVDVVNSTLEDWQLHFYMIYRIHESLALRMGHAFFPYQFGAGVDLLLWDDWVVQIGARYHPVLRWSPGIGFHIPLKRN